VVVVVVAADGDDMAAEVVFTNGSDVGDDVHVNEGVEDEGGVLCGDVEPSGLLLSVEDGCWWVELGVAGDGCCVSVGEWILNCCCCCCCWC